MCKLITALAGIFGFHSLHITAVNIPDIVLAEACYAYGSLYVFHQRYNCTNSIEYNSFVYPYMNRLVDEYEVMNSTLAVSRMFIRYTIYGDLTIHLFMHIRNR